MKPLPRIIAPTLLVCLAAVAARPAAAQNFAAPVTLPLSGAYVALADFNGDGQLDLIAAFPGHAGYLNFIPGGPGGVSISLGDGKGNFATASIGGSFSYGTSGPLNLALGDFNNDGRADVICPISGGTSISSGSSNGTPFDGTTIGVLFGAAPGAYNPSSSYAVGDTPTAALVGDFNHDGIPDVAVTNASGILTVYLGVGGGLYQGGIVYHVGGNPTAIRAGDFNHDGKPDLATVNASDGSLSILINNGDGTFQKPQRLAVGANLRDAALADLNGDGRTDIVALRAGEIDVFINNSNGTFTLRQTYSASTTATALLLADFSGSGRLDALTNDVVLTQGIGSAAGNTALGTYSGNLAVGDVNGDGKLDFIVGSKLYLNIGSNSSAPLSLIVDITPEGVTAASVSSDQRGHLQLLGPGGIATDVYFYDRLVSSFSNLPANGCSLRITYPDYLTVDIPLHGTSGVTQYLTITLPAGDANGDNIVDSTDFGILIGAYGGLANVLGSGYDSRADFNLDGSVDSTDFGLLIGNYGRQGDP